MSAAPPEHARPRQATSGQAGDDDSAEPPATAPDRLSTRGRRARALVTVACSLALVTGTFWGTDDHFPFGPFKMYSNAARTDGLVRSARLEAVNAEGERFKLTDASTGLRRAEIEGQMPLFRGDPSRLELVADAYHSRHPDSPELLLVEILQRRYQLVDGQPSGEVTEHQIAAWTAPGHEELAEENADPPTETDDGPADDGPHTADERMRNMHDDGDDDGDPRGLTTDERADDPDGDSGTGGDPNDGDSATGGDTDESVAAGDAGEATP